MGSKSPAIAGVLTILIIGLGHAYLGEWTRMLALWFLIFVSLVLTFSGMMFLGFVLYAFVFLFAVYDAIRLAS